MSTRKWATAVRQYNIDVHVNAKVEAYMDGNVIYSDVNGEQSAKADTVIVSIGYNSANTLANELENAYVIGDASKVSNLMGAIWQAYEIAMTI